MPRAHGRNRPNDALLLALARGCRVPRSQPACVVVADNGHPPQRRCPRARYLHVLGTRQLENLVRHPGDHDTLLALVSFSRDAGDVAAALGYAEQLARVAPGEPGLAGLIENLRRQIKEPDAR